MSFAYSQETGELIHIPTQEIVVKKGYSGAIDNTHGTNPHAIVGKNDPCKESLQNIGPIPQGKYSIATPISSPKFGKLVFRLKPFPDNKMYGRSGFLIHGDSIKKPGTASTGCIIASYPERSRLGVLMNTHNDTKLVVVKNLSKVEDTLASV